jgi:Zn-dependent protease with chaperone function
LKTTAKFEDGLSSFIGELEIRERKLFFQSSALSFFWDEYEIEAILINGILTIRSTVSLSQKLIVQVPGYEKTLKSELGIKAISASRSYLRSHSFLTPFIILLILLSTVGLGLFFLRSNTHLLLSFVSEETEREIGEEIFRKNFEAKVLIPKKLAKKWVEFISAANPSSVRGYSRTYIIDESVPNAFALPGGIIIFTKGFILDAESPEEILGVFAHELGHLRHRHGIQAYIADLGTTAVSLVLGGSASTITQSLDALNALKHSRVHEREADRFALKLLKEQKISSSGIKQFFSRMKQDSIPDGFLSWASTHPTDDERIRLFNIPSRFSDIQFPLSEFKKQFR